MAENASGGGFIRSSSWSRPLFRYLVTIATFATFVLMAAGFYSVSIGGNPSCHGFPLCNGHLFPFLHPQVVAASGYSAHQVFAEWFHRAIGFVTGVTMLAASIIALRDKGINGTARWTAVGATVFMPLEAWLGVVTSGVNPPTGYVLIHLVVSWIVFLALLVSAFVLWRGRLSFSGPGETRT